MVRVVSFKDTDGEREKPLRRLPFRKADAARPMTLREWAREEKQKRDSSV